MAEGDLSARLDAAWGHADTWTANGLQWTHLEEIQAMTHRQVSGDAAVTRMGWFAGHLAAQGLLPARRVLVLGCGSGRVERELHAMGWAQEIVAFDLSPMAVESARAATAGMAGVQHVVASMDALPVGQAPFLPGSFDAVFGISSVHHCGDLDSLYRAVSRLLTPHGWFFLDEYVGPDRFQFSDTVAQQVQALLDLLPDRLVTTRAGILRRGFRASTVDEVVAVDPSEAIHSSAILPMLDRHFEVVAQRPYGGTLLHLLLADVAQNFQPAESKPWLRALIDAEADLDRLGRLEHYFSCAIARPLRSPSAAG